MVAITKKIKTKEKKSFLSGFLDHFEKSINNILKKDKIKNNIKNDNNTSVLYLCEQLYTEKNGKVIINESGIHKNITFLDKDLNKINNLVLFERIKYKSTDDYYIKTKSGISYIFDINNQNKDDENIDTFIAKKEFNYIDGKEIIANYIFEKEIITLGNINGEGVVIFNLFDEDNFYNFKYIKNQKQEKINIYLTFKRNNSISILSKDNKFYSYINNGVVEEFRDNSVYNFINENKAIFKQNFKNINFDEINKGVYNPVKDELLINNSIIGNGYIKYKNDYGDEKPIFYLIKNPDKVIVKLNSLNISCPPELEFRYNTGVKLNLSFQHIFNYIKCLNFIDSKIYIHKFLKEGFQEIEISKVEVMERIDKSMDLSGDYRFSHFELIT